ncbi:MAG: flagellar biosynthesis anti-sigma factor FlgM [Ferrimonas sp.]
MDITKLHGSNLRPMVAQVSETSGRARTNDTSASPKSSEGVKLTEQAQQLQQAEAAVMNASGIDMDKVNAVKAAISEGRYVIDADKLADNIARFESDLAGFHG